MKAFFSIFVVFAALNANAFFEDYEPTYLEAEGTGFYVTVGGDGYESGFAHTINNVYVAGRMAATEEEIPLPAFEIRNDSADCNPYASIKAVEKKTFNTGNGQHYYWLVDYRIEVSTSVNGDTGGCLVLVTKPGGQEGAQSDVIRIIRYGYSTNY